MKAVAVAGSGLGAVAAAAVLAWMLLNGSPSEELYPGLKLLSPNGQHAAFFFGTGGGGAAGWSYQYVGVGQAGAAFDAGRYVLRMRRGYQVCLRWVRDNTLLVQYPEQAVVEVRQDRFEADGRVDIEFEAVESEGGMLRSECRGQIGTLHSPGGGWDVKD
jgi:hypothetical protein